MEAHGLLAEESLSSLQYAFSSSDRLIEGRTWMCSWTNCISLKEKLFDLSKMCSVRNWLFQRRKNCLLNDSLTPPENLMKALALGNIRESQWVSWLRFWCFFNFAVMWKSIYISLFFFIYWYILAISEKGSWTTVGWSVSSIWRTHSFKVEELLLVVELQP